MSNGRGNESSSSEEARSWASYVDDALNSLGKALSSAGHAVESKAGALNDRLRSLAASMEQGYQDLAERSGNRSESEPASGSSQQRDVNLDPKKRFEEFLEMTTQATTKMMTDMSAKFAEMDASQSGTTPERNPKVEEEREWKANFLEALETFEEMISKKNRDALVEGMNEQWNMIKDPKERERMKAKVKEDLDEVAKKYSEYLSEIRKSLESTSRSTPKIKSE